MNREIKFRAWDKEAENMFIIFDANKQTEWFLPMWKDRYEVMQYTGLKDKNGKKIYEGDILRVTNAADEVNALNSDTGIGVVEWLDKWGFWNISNIENGLGDILNWGHAEVIGNIFEDGDLIANR